MQIILLERIEKLGTIGDVVTVKDGYARNFLLPNKKALRANAPTRSCSKPSVPTSRSATPKPRPLPKRSRAMLTARAWC
jgi:hypothetical protein